MRATRKCLILIFGILLAACDGNTSRTIDVTADQEESMCHLLFATASTGPVPKQASAEMGDAPSVSAQGIKMPVELREFEDGMGGFVKLSLDPADAQPVFLLLDEAIPFEVVHEDGSTVDFVEAAEESALCEDAGGRYSWFVEDGTNYLKFGPTDDADSLNFVLSTVD